jgi:hypothetical protein
MRSFAPFPKSLFIIACVLGLAAGCGKPATAPAVRFGHECDADRKKRLLPVIEASWIPSQRNDGETIWAIELPEGEEAPSILDEPYGRRSAPPRSYGPGAHHTTKSVHYRGNTLEAEEDLYCKSIAPGTRRPSETLSIRYEYGKPESPWTCWREFDGKLEELSLPEAEKLLRTWGIERLNYAPGEP